MLPRKASLSAATVPVPHAEGEVRDALVGRYGHQAWVRTIDELDAEGWYGRPLGRIARGRLGDVAVVPWEPVGYLDPDDRKETNLVCRHGSLTPEEVLVPLLAAAH
jgi:hypothetical protein